jgi:pimeloyl-ACP methyl ester carboxylesterase
VLGGTSLGANASLEAAAAAPDRVSGLVLEMPVLDNALLACAIALTPLLVGLTFGAPVARALAAGVRRLPRASHASRTWRSMRSARIPSPRRPCSRASFFGRVAPPSEVRSAMKQPTLVIGHGRDPIHPFSDSDMLVREMPNARLVEASSILELQLTPERLTEEIAGFLPACFRPKRRAAGRPRGPARARRNAPRRS